MGRKCCVIGCNNDYKNNKVFRLPSEKHKPEERARWIKAIPRDTTAYDIESCGHGISLSKKGRGFFTLVFFPYLKIHPTMEENTHTIINGNVNENVLDALNKQQLIQMVLNLNQTISKLHEDFQRVTNLRLYHLERNLCMSQQYNRRDTLEIIGIPMHVEEQQMEDEIIEIFKDAKVTVNRQNIKKMDVQAAHRIGKKGVVIVKVVNRKFIRAALINGKNLASNKRYGDETRLFLNDSFTSEFRFLNYVIRRAAKDKRLFKYKVRNGVNFVQKDQDSNFIEIGHANDLDNLGIEIPSRV